MAPRMNEPSDVDLVRRLGSHERSVRESAFSTLFERHRQKAFDLAWRVLGDSALAADAVQEAFLTVYRKGPRFEARAQFTSWLYRVVLNQSIDLQRRERRHRTLHLGDLGSSDDTQRGRGRGSESVAEPAAPTLSPEATSLEAERAAIVRAALARLSPKLAAVVIMRYPEGRSYEEIGEILGLPPGTVRSRLNRAHAALRDLLVDRLDNDA
jgi:RNA polymerase sigma-70 factor (ECF subfamily)